MESAEPWVILDARAVMHHCIRAGKDPEGILGEDGELYNTAEFAFRNFLNRYMEPVFNFVAPRQVLIAMDGGIDYRQSIFPDYKAKREAAKKERDPVDIDQSVRFYTAMKQFWAATGCNISRVKGVEADDLIAYFCEKLPGKKMVYTTDGDLMALVHPKYNSFVQLKLEAQLDDVFKFSGGPAEGVPVGDLNLMTLVKSLLGDTSDEYPGIKGFGPKKWSDMVKAYGYDGMQELEKCVVSGDFTDLDDAYEACPNDKGLKLMVENKESWKIQYDLAKLHPELCEGTHKNKIVKIEWFRRIPELVRLEKVLDDMFCLKTHLEKFEDWCVRTWLLDSESLEEGDLDEALMEFAKSPCVAFDYETQDDHHPQFDEAATRGNYVDIMTSKIAGASFCFGNNSQYCFYMPVKHKDSGNVPIENLKVLLEEFPTEHTPLVAHSNAFEIGVTELNLSLELEDVHDTSIMSSYVDENERAGLKSSSKREFNYDQVSYEEVVGDRAGMFEVTADEVLKYGCDDSIVSAHLFHFYKLRMMLEGSWDFFRAQEPFVQNPLTDAYLNGVEVDWERLAKIHKDDLKIIDEGMKFIRKGLTEHCLKPNEAGVIEYFKAEEVNREVLFRQAAKKSYEKFCNGKSDKEVGLALKQLTINKQLEARLSSLQADEAAIVGDQIAEELEDAFLADNPEYDPISAGVQIRNMWVEDVVSKKMTDLREKVTLASQYVPYSEELIAPEFKPTPTNFNKVVTSLGILTPIESVAKSRISEWVALVTDYNFDDKETDNVITLNDDQKAFVDALASASNEIKKREGAEYDKLVAICQPYLGEGKMVSTGDALNTSSPDQVQHLIYVKLGLPVRLRSMPQFGSTRHKLGLDGSPGTDDLSIKTALAHDMEEDDWRKEVLETLLKVKESSTRCSLYHTKYPLWKHPNDGRMHPQIKNCGTVTRRPSGTSPNILQVSKHKIDGAMRGVYLPHKEKFDVCTNIWIPYEEPRVIIAPDFSQQELRILASECGDSMMQSAYIGDDLKDIHSLTASGIAGIDYHAYEEIRNEEIRNDDNNPRQSEMEKIRKGPAKQTNFLIAYMGTPFTLSTNLIIPYDDAKDFMNKTFELYPGILEWQEAMGVFGRLHGYTQTAYGNRRHLSNTIFTNDDQARRRMERQAANAVIQGTAADILKVVLAQMHKRKIFKQTNSIMIAPIYDEIASTVPVSKAVEYLDRTIEVMEITPPNHAVPMVADVSIGPDWQLLDEIGVRPSEDKIMASCEKAIKIQEEKEAARKAA